MKITVNQFFKLINLVLRSIFYFMILYESVIKHQYNLLRLSLQLHQIYISHDQTLDDRRMFPLKNSTLRRSIRISQDTI